MVEPPLRGMDDHSVIFFIDFLYVAAPNAIPVQTKQSKGFSPKKGNKKAEIFRFGLPQFLRPHTTFLFLAMI